MDDERQRQAEATVSKTMTHLGTILMVGPNGESEIVTAKSTAMITMSMHRQTVVGEGRRGDTGEGLWFEGDRIWMFSPG